MSKESDRRLTPTWLLNVVREFATIGLDPCTEPHNPTGATDFIHPGEEDGLSMTWCCVAGEVVWVNPPFSRGEVQRWAEKCVAESDCLDIILLTKDDCRTAWNRYLVDNADARCRIHRSVGFLEPADDGTWKKLVGPAWGTALWYWGRRRRRFARVFGAIGEVTQLLGPQE